MLKTSLGRLRICGWIEGTSFLMLLGIAMPLKYMMDMPTAGLFVGLFHGLAWMVYVGGLFSMFLARSWPVMILLGGTLASVLPFGPFIFDRYLPRDDA